MLLLFLVSLLYHQISYLSILRIDIIIVVQLNSITKHYLFPIRVKYFFSKMLYVCI
jgi:hypothetical protein